VKKLIATFALACFLLAGVVGCGGTTSSSAAKPASEPDKTAK
jgi:hypothetical protein